VARPDELEIDRRAPVRRVELDAGSWVELVDGFVRDPDRHMANVLDDTSWMQNEVLRYDRYVPERRLSAGLRAGDHPLLRQTELHLQSRWRVEWDGVAAILYRDGDDFQGFHGDREMRWLDDTLIAIVVLGERRPFVLRPRATSSQLDRTPAGEHTDDIVLTPGRGDLLVMGGACQRDWLHTVPIATTSRPRISLTWRWSSRRGRPDTNPTYYDGRSYSDSPRRPPTRGRPARR
jgi:alkylated DNA repair dioxygenase AlkB